MLKEYMLWRDIVTSEGWKERVMDFFNISIKETGKTMETLIR